jgi:hypothetical protein
MRKFVIERDMPKVGSLSETQICEASAKSNDVIAKLAPDVQWQQSYVTDDKIYCVYLAKDEASVRRHAELAGFPANRISEVRRVIDPATAR